MHARIWYEPDGSVKVTVFPAGQPLDQCLAACRTLIQDGRVHPESASEDVLTREALVDRLPGSRAFRAHWRGHPGAGVRVDLPGARAQRMAEIRAQRDAALAATDGPMLRAQERGEDTTALAAHRQALRDLPLTVQWDLDAIRTPESLEAYRPPLL
jgi:hypothetical protein